MKEKMLCPRVILSPRHRVTDEVTGSPCLRITESLLRVET